MDAMKKAQKFTSVAKDLQTELQNTEIETTVRQGQVKVILSAQQFPIKVEVSEELVKLGHEEVRTGGARRCGARCVFVGT